MKRQDSLSRDQIIEALTFLGWHTRNEDGTIPDDVFNVARNLSGKVVESPMLSSFLATAMDEERARLKAVAVVESRAGVPREDDWELMEAAETLAKPTNSPV